MAALRFVPDSLTLQIFGCGPIRRLVVIRANLVGRYLVGPLLFLENAVSDGPRPNDTVRDLCRIMHF